MLERRVVKSTLLPRSMPADDYTNNRHSFGIQSQQHNTWLPMFLQSNTEDRPLANIETDLALRKSKFDPSMQVTYFSVYERIYPET
jgi:hypothetical protein